MKTNDLFLWFFIIGGFVTAAIGILMGIGFYFPAVMATLLTLGTLSPKVAAR
jgi:uncharacterized membrane protein YhiD involved in acid resistance